LVDGPEIAGTSRTALGVRGGGSFNGAVAGQDRLAGK
jgi:hypothetical protein